MNKVMKLSALALVASVMVGGCTKEEKLMCTIYQVIGENRVPLKTVEVKNSAECDALLEEYRRRGR